MHRKSVSELESDEFEWVCGGIIGDIASDYGMEPTGPPELMAPTHDGGIEAKIPTSSGDVAVQCKKYPKSGFEKEAKNVQSSFKQFLNCPDHTAVTMFIWCSPASRTAVTGGGIGKGQKAADAIQDMQAVAKAKGRKVAIEIRFAEDLNRIIRERRPEYFAVMAGLAPIGFDDVKRYSTSCASEILSRLGEDETPQLEFPVHRTSDFLDRLEELSTPPRLVEVVSIHDQLDEISRRARDILSHQSIDRDFRADAARVVEAVSPLQGQSSVPAEQLRMPLKTLRDEARAVYDETEVLLKAHWDGVRNRSDGDKDKRQTLKSILRLLKSLLALLQHADEIYCQTEAALTQKLLITGRWGTGKSYQLAEYTRRALASKTPVLLLRARDFTRPDQPILSQPWRGSFDNENATSAEIAAMLDSIGRRAVIEEKRPLVLIIDGLSESSILDPRKAIQRLQETISKFPSIRLIVSNRRDRMPTGETIMPELVHLAPDRVTMSRSVERALNAPPGTDWHAALTNPLLASIAVRLLAAHPGDSERLLSRTSLFQAWRELLVSEAAANLQQPEATIRRVITAIADPNVENDISELAKASCLHGQSNDVDLIVDRLADEGFLETISSGVGSVRFRWEGMGDMQRAQWAINNEAIDEFIRDPDEDRQLALLELVAEILPQNNLPRELPDFRLPSATENQRNLAFALSLNMRADKDVHDETLQHAERMLRQGGDASQAIVWSVLSVPRRTKLSFVWLNEQLRNSALSRRASFWPYALEDLCERSHVDQQDMEDLLSWYVYDFWPSLPPEDVGPAVEMLAWMACADPATELPAYAIRSVTEILQRHPGQLERVLERLRDVDDDHPRDALYTAAVGVVARWPQSDAARTVRNVCWRALDRDPSPLSFRSLAAIHSATNSELPIHEFLKQSLPPLQNNRWSRMPHLVGDDDRAMFADGRSTRQAELFETSILDSFGIAKKHRRVVIDDNDRVTDSGHGRSLLRGRWLARQYANHPFGGRMWKRHSGLIKAGTPENGSTVYLDDPDDAWDFYVDPTVPMWVTFHNSDAVHLDTWWAVRSVPSTNPSNVLQVTDPDGVEWVVIKGEFRVLEPPRQPTSDRPKLRIGRNNWMFGRDDDGRPVPGQSRREFIRVSDAQLDPPPDDDAGTVSRRSLRESRFADSFALTETDGALLSARIDGGVAPLTASLLQLLDARWTGWGLDCVNSAAELVITDPAVGKDAPHAVLVRRDTLLTALESSGKKLAVQLETTNLRSVGMSRKESTAVTIG